MSRTIADGMGRKQGPHFSMGMRPPAIGTGRRQGIACTRTALVEAEA